jgi:hypothetical protein
MVLFSNWRAKACSLRRALGTGVPKQLKVSKEKEDVIGWLRVLIWLNALSSSLPHLRVAWFAAITRRDGITLLCQNQSQATQTA